jgi:hypothetical protein
LASTTTPTHPSSVILFSAISMANRKECFSKTELASGFIERLVSGEESLSIVGAFEGPDLNGIEETLHLFRGFGRTSDHLPHALRARSTQDDPS